MRTLVVTDAPLKIRLFGQFEICAGESQLKALGTRKSTGMFSHLVLHRGHSICREQMAELFWPNLDEAAGRKALRTELWRIRRSLSSIGVDPAKFLQVTRSDIAFRQDAACEIDVCTFEDEAAPFLAYSVTQINAGHATTLERCLRRYRGELLENDLSDWCEPHRRELRAIYIHALDLLMGYYETTERWDAAIAIGLRLIALDSLLEHVYFALMRCYIAKADRGLAIRCYQALRRVMRDELGISPARKIASFYDELLRDNQTSASMPALTHDKRPNPLLDDANRALQSVNRAATLLNRISKSL